MSGNNERGLAGGRDPLPKAPDVIRQSRSRRRCQLLPVIIVTGPRLPRARGPSAGGRGARGRLGRGAGARWTRGNGPMAPEPTPSRPRWRTTRRSPRRRDARPQAGGDRTPIPLGCPVQEAAAGAVSEVSVSGVTTAIATSRREAARPLPLGRGGSACFIAHWG